MNRIILHDGRFHGLVGRYATPLAILLVGLALLVSQPQKNTAWICAFLLVFGAVFNVVLPVVMESQTDNAKSLLSKIRLVLNLSINTLLVYFLGSYFPPIWLLMVLTPVATAIYSSYAKTLIVSIVVCSLLIGIQSFRGLDTPLAWGQQASYAGFTILLSLMVNELAAFAHNAKKGET